MTALLEVLGEVHPQEEMKGACRKVADLSKGYEGLRGLRNDVVHNFAGVSRDKIERAYGGKVEDILERCREVLEGLGISVGENPFDLWNGWIGERWLEIV